ncbi:GNAT superfamily N-acetyltransferase [Aminobacter lissarensis]|uniref:GNAT superfamily N-acetyltransferase n=1 Tax=Aminobacter carboxidus TaxID=376165 RepID=A0A8E1WB21_9HYPH|nr:GNAT family N-acetyltransferase [Aminobacter lissarensis]MBB6465406.1 GNAT superfamily N-acetyltransferase [Aminobacter lissarensis]
MPGYRPGLIADIVRLHAEYYAREWGFGLPFEAKVAGELSAFMTGFRTGLDFFAAEDDDNGALLGTISLEAPLQGEPLAHLRWFITSDQARGTGLGRRLMDEAIAHADVNGFPGIYLTTFDGLKPARHLYERFGFALVAEEERDQWSGGVREQRFERHKVR